MARRPLVLDGNLRKHYRLPPNGRLENVALPDSNYSLVGMWPDGISAASAVRERWLFFGNGSALETFDILDKHSPIKTSRVLTQGTIMSMCLKDTFLYVISWGLLSIFDVANPTSPMLLGKRQFSASVIQSEAPATSGDTSILFAMTEPGTLLIIDVTNPTSPEYLSSIPVAERAYFTSNGKFVYFGTAEQPGAYVADLSSPSVPQIKKFSQTFGYSAFISDTLLCVGGTFFSISDPWNPFLIGTNDSAAFWRVTAYGGIAYGTSGADFRAVDIHDPLNVLPLSTISDVFAPENFLISIACDGSTGIIPSDGKVVLIDLSSGPSHAAIAAEIVVGGISENIAVQGDFAYVASGPAGLWVLDVSDPSNPRPVGNAFLNEGYITDVAISNTTACIAGTDIAWDSVSGLWTIDISNPAHPTVLAHHRGITHKLTSGNNSRIFASGARVYLTQSPLNNPPLPDTTVEIIDISNPSAPTMLGSISLGSGFSPINVAASDSLLMISSYDGLHIFSILNPSAPALLNEGNYPPAFGFALHGGYLYGSRSDSLFIWAMHSNRPDSLVGSLEYQSVSGVQSGHWNCSTAGTFLAWASGTLGLVDVSNPSHPTELATYQGSEYITGGILKDNFIFATDYYGSVKILSYSPLRAVEFSSGWNLVSIPRQRQSSRPDSVFHVPISPLYSYRLTGYMKEDHFAPGQGYWIKTGESDTILPDGLPLDSLTLPVAAGWNLIGSVANPIPVMDVQTSDPDLLLTPFFGFDGSQYFSATELEPWRAYWVKTRRAGFITLTSKK